MANSSRLEISVKDQLSLYDILKVFNNPINEEQAWAICHQCVQYFNVKQPQEKLQEFFLYGIQALRLKKDGEIYVDSSANTDCQLKILFCTKKQRSAIRTLGVTIFKALDHGFHENEERQLSHDLENLIDLMTHEDDETDESQTADDEGIEKDAEDDFDTRESPQHCTFKQVELLCTHHLSSRQDTRHYKAVCRALVTEAQELISFLDKISTGQQNLSNQSRDNDSRALDDLESSDWARLWVQIMRQLRQGVRLKKVEHVNFPPVEYELTPFEILLEDIRSRRYALHKIMINGELPQKVKTDAHNVILDFIRSRPPLKKAKDRKLKTLPPNPPDPRELLLSDIRSIPKLRPTSRTTLDSSDEELSPQPIRKIIKPDFNLLLNNSFDVSYNFNHYQSVPNMSEHVLFCSSACQHRNYATTSERRQCTLVRRHTIMVCESPTDGKVVQQELPPLEEEEPCESPKPPIQNLSDLKNYTSPETVTCCGKRWRNPIECLNLTLEEVTHIRSVLTKAELESLITQPTLYNQVAKSKICFTCKKVKFSLFGEWGTKCKFCKRSVCSKCLRKMNVPTEHFKNIPVHTLCPGSPTHESKEAMKKLVK
ncbi:hypothetical protein LOTGIDRAFT_117664 [Lottia gigantea]|uniref:KIND domain-containing protein n=1 Tax=Lottia gigantea TaxID=225164 RepID=V4ADR4_LOTGI|nr:hypothetical protein LOTGIDRAFT_117664 [Lottia gigantea]ESO94992.1 hypothetical protein LOTGIDRAFT_117664 [Lottia gigantea]